MTALKRTPRRALAAALIVALGALAAAGCASEPEADLDAGKQIFVNSCASCHTLADADSASDIGPNLDDAFRASRQAGMDDVQFRGVVRRWIELAQLPMPRDIVTGQDAEDVSAYVAAVAGLSEESVVRAAPPETPEVPSPSRQDIN